MADSRDDFIISIRYALLKKGAKQKFSLFFLIIMSGLIITLDKLSIPFILTTRAVLNDLVYQVSFVASTPGKFISYLNEKKKIHFNIVDRNEILKNEIETLKRNNYEIIYLKTENYSLKQALDLKATRSGDNLTSVKAKVTFDQESPYLKSFLISKGKKHGIIKGMTVFSKGYLIGTIVEANFLTSRVLLITDLNSKIPVVIQDTEVNAILTGSGERKNFNLEFLPEEFILESKKIIYTSGKDGFLATGLPVAETYLDKKNKLRIRSLADPQQASIVHITDGYANK